MDNTDGQQGNWQQLESLEHLSKPDPKIWATVERIESGASDDGPSEPLAPGMKKTTWNVRR